MATSSLNKMNIYIYNKKMKPLVATALNKKLV